MGPNTGADSSVAAGRHRRPGIVLPRRPGVSVPPHTPILTRTWTLRGRPTDAPLKNAPFNGYFLSNTLSTYTWGRNTVFPTTNAYPALALRTKLGSTWFFLLKAKRPLL